jgi:DNA-binding transcriptional LysR family regulator
MKKTGLAELQAVVAVAARRSFRRAAMDLGMSPSALSHSVAVLEQRLGVRLFNRTTRAVSLSEAGEQFLARVSPALEEIFEAMEAANDQRDIPAGTLRINASEGAAQIVMVPIMVEYLRRYPTMRLEIVAESRMVDIVAQGFDAGIRQSDSVAQDMIAVPCSGPLRFAVVGSPAYFAMHGTPSSPADLASHNCVRTRFQGGGAIYKWDFGKRGRHVSIEVEGTVTLDSEQLMITAALQGIGLAWISEHAVQRELAARRLIRVLDDWSPAYPGLSLYYPGHRHVPAGLRALIEVVREVVPASRGGGTTEA